VTEEENKIYSKALSFNQMLTVKRAESRSIRFVYNTKSTLMLPSQRGENQRPLLGGKMTNDFFDENSKKSLRI